jgi:hypothetical protein
MKLSYNEAADVNDLLDKLITFARHKSYEYKKVGPDVLEIDKSGTWRLFSGQSASLRILVTIKQRRTEIDLGGYQKEFVLKAVIGIIAFVFLPLLILPVYGAFRQYRLMEAVTAEVNDYFNNI